MNIKGLAELSLYIREQYNSLHENAGKIDYNSGQ